MSSEHQGEETAAPTLDELARQQGIQPIRSITDLRLADVEDGEDFDKFQEAVMSARGKTSSVSGEHLATSVQASVEQKYLDTMRQATHLARLLGPAVTTRLDEQLRAETAPGGEETRPASRDTSDGVNDE